MDRVLGNKSSKKAKDPDLATLVPKPAKTWSFQRLTCVVGLPGNK